VLEILEQNIDALIVVDEQRTLRGVVKREQIFSGMILSLVR